MRRWSEAQRLNGKKIGFVPTMGALHQGHLDLVKRAQKVSDAVVVSIFVNPTQFAANEDLSRYPRDIKKDCKACREIGVVAIFMPDAADIYADNSSVWVIEESLSQNWCGSSRPTHFRGVCTVVAKLFNIVQPQTAVFGQKDFQQVAVIRQMTRDLHFPIKIVMAPITREPDGLAMSSRNVYLSLQERENGLGLYKALQLAQKCFGQDEKNATSLSKKIDTVLQSHNLKIDYVAIVDDKTLEPVKTVKAGNVILLAAYAGKTRLIDNAILR